MADTLKLTKLKCKKCSITCLADAETVDLTIDTCYNHKKHDDCGIRKIRDTLRSIEARLEKQKVAEVPEKRPLVDADLISFYPHRKCHVCDQDVATAYECKAVFHHVPDHCPLIDSPKKQLPILLVDKSKQWQRKVEAISGVRVCSIDHEKKEYEFEMADPIDIFIDKKGRYA